MKKHKEAISDCESALSLNPKCTKSLVQKGNALIGLGLFDEAKICYESLRPLGEGALADSYLKKVHDAQERAEIFESWYIMISEISLPLLKVSNTSANFMPKKETK